MLRKNDIRFVIWMLKYECKRIAYLGNGGEHETPPGRTYRISSSAVKGPRTRETAGNCDMLESF